jgi:tRNA(fMet)-specific endonuclease VapC
MLVLDTDHIVILQSQGSRERTTLENNLNQSGDDVATTIVTAEELMRGWLAQIHRQRDVHRQINSYKRLHDLFQFFSQLEVLAWDVPAADMFVQLRQAKVRIPTMDLKIACIALAQGAKLLSRNIADFSQVPGVVVEDWTK